jgi:hypothetical protein
MAREAQAMKNVSMNVVGRKLVIEVDMDQNFGRSAGGTGKTNVIATSSGFSPIPGFDQTWLSLNVNTKNGVK